MDQEIDINEAVRIVHQCRKKPAWWVEQALGKKLWAEQYDIVQKLLHHRRIAVRSCHAAGKSFLAACTVLWWISAYKGAIAITTAPTFRQVKKVIWQEIRRCYNGARFPIGGECLATELRMGDSWYAMGLSTDDPDAFQGIHSYSGRVLVVLDEASGIPRELYPAIEGIATGDHCRILSIGNPTDPASSFADECRSKDVTRVRISAFDTPNFTDFGITLKDIKENTWEEKIDGQELPAPHLITPRWVFEMFNRWGEQSPMFQSRVLAEFPEQGTDTLIPLSWIERAQNNDVAPTGDPNVIAVDVARYGGDETTIYHRRGAKLRLHHAARGTSTTETTGQSIRALRQLEASEILVDGAGLGAGVVDQLRDQNKPVRELNGANRANDNERFLNARAEWFWQLREAFDPSLPGEVDLDDTDDVLASQLSTIKYTVTRKGQIQIESKEDMRRRGLPSPDRADAASMAWVSDAAPDFPTDFQLDGFGYKPSEYSI
jgi:hypothetical protein